MVFEIFNLHHRVCLKVIGIWPGIKRDWTVISIVGWSVFFLYAVLANITEDYKDWNSASTNILASVGNVVETLALIFLKSKQRYNRLLL